MNHAHLQRGGAAFMSTHGDMAQASSYSTPNELRRVAPPNTLGLDTATDGNATNRRLKSCRL